MRRWLGMLVLSIAVTTPSPVRADAARADSLFREARALMKQEEYARACPLLEESYRLDPAAGTAVNLGDCFDKQGKVGSALLAYQVARALLKPGDARTTPVARQIAALEKRAPRLTITLAPGAPQGTKVTRDGRDVSPSDLGKAVHVNPGSVVLEVTAPGRSTQRRTLSLAEGETTQFVAEPGEAGEDAGSGQSASGPTRDTTTEEGSSSTTGLVLGGIGVVGVTTGIVTALMANSRMETVQANCDSNKVCRNQEGIDAAESGKTLTTVSYVGWGIGIVGLAAGSYFLLTGKSGSSEGSNTIVDATADGRGGRITLRGSFW